MSVRIGRTWHLYAHRYESGSLMHVGEKQYVEHHMLPDPIIPVLAEEVLDDLYAPEVTHYGWQYVEGSRNKRRDSPSMIQLRAGTNPKYPTRALMLLSMCFPYGLDAAIKAGEGTIVALRITERTDV